MLGPFCESESGNCYVLMVVDQFTRWLELVPLPAQDAESVARAIFENYLVQFGVPLTVHTDQGRNFDANGQVERYNQLVLNYLRCYLGGKQRGTSGTSTSQH